MIEDPYLNDISASESEQHFSDFQLAALKLATHLESSDKPKSRTCYNCHSIHQDENAGSSSFIFCRICTFPKSVNTEEYADWLSEDNWEELHIESGVMPFQCPKCYRPARPDTPYCSYCAAYNFCYFNQSRGECAGSYKAGTVSNLSLGNTPCVYCKVPIHSPGAHCSLCRGISPQVNLLNTPAEHEITCPQCKAHIPDCLDMIFCVNCRFPIQAYKKTRQGTCSMIGSPDYQKKHETMMEHLLKNPPIPVELPQKDYFTLRKQELQVDITPSEIENSRDFILASSEQKRTLVKNQFPIVDGGEVVLGTVFRSNKPLAIPVGEDLVYATYQKVDNYFICVGVSNEDTLFDNYVSVMLALTNKNIEPCYITILSDRPFVQGSCIAAITASLIGYSLPYPITGAFIQGNAYLPNKTDVKLKALQDKLIITALPEDLTEKAKVNSLKALTGEFFTNGTVNLPLMVPNTVSLKILAILKFPRNIFTVTDVKLTKVSQHQDTNPFAPRAVPVVANVAKAKAKPPTPKELPEKFEWRSGPVGGTIPVQKALSDMKMFVSENPNFKTTFPQLGIPLEKLALFYEPERNVENKMKILRSAYQAYITMRSVLTKSTQATTTDKQVNFKYPNEKAKKDAKKLRDKQKKNKERIVEFGIKRIANIDVVKNSPFKREAEFDPNDDLNHDYRDQEYYEERGINPARESQHNAFLNVRNEQYGEVQREKELRGEELGGDKFETFDPNVYDY